MPILQGNVSRYAELIAYFSISKLPQCLSFPASGCVINFAWVLKCSFGHVKDEGYQLWQVLSEALGEDINKSNFCATVERLGIGNPHSSLVNPVQIGHLNLCNISEKSRSNQWGDVNSNSESDLNSSQTKAISNLIQLGLKPEQIAEALDLPLDEVENIMEM